MATFGTLKELEPENEKISSYLEHMELYFIVNGIEEEKQVAVLLSIIGAKMHSLLLHDLVAPANLKQKTFADLANVLKKHFEPKPFNIAKRFTFHRRN